MFKPRTAPITEQGFTLVELLVYSAFSVIILSLVGGMLISSLAAQKTIVSRAEASTTGQLLSQSIHGGVRNASAMQVIEDGQMLVVATAKDGKEEAGEFCQAWVYIEADNAVYYQRAAAGKANYITTPIAGDLEGWLMLGDGITPNDSAKPFFVSLGTPPNEVAVSFLVDTGSDNSPVLFESTTIARQPETGSSACFD
ncbi:hypothetical protein E3O25_10345 [Cryobacterium sp. TMT1-3]|uniref:hypothetical protein n=1 Tax=Cryobacterium sp. TMT1-3 TaxID=1259237 RepID=UPI00106C6FAB|nr:hypothetical protein [Cryobacterium sp. TMT1-3]TFC27484.1 hypothetical protein E3O25_10345 [Cryobacterium sp. TMT1-3]